MSAIAVRHALGRYDVHVEPGILWSLPELLATALGGRKLVLITDDTVAGYQDEWSSATVRHSSEARAPAIRLRCEARLTFPAGEVHKNRETWAGLSDDMLRRGLDRQAGIVALGGGVVGDLAGFVAATFLRGIPYAQVPTTLLAMLDASVGGKVGVDTPQGKNLIGAFHPPAIVVADPLTLLSLPDRVFRAGRYWVSQWYLASHRIAYWDMFGRPATKPRYGRGIPETWWYDRGKAAKLDR